MPQSHPASFEKRKKKKWRKKPVSAQPRESAPRYTSKIAVPFVRQSPCQATLQVAAFQGGEGGQLQHGIALRDT